MRAVLPLGAAAILLAGCHRNAETSNAVSVDDNSAVSSIGLTNDMTSIDAADADAANMAADLPPDDIPNLAADQAANAAQAASAASANRAASRAAATDEHRPAPRRSSPATAPAGAGNSSAPADTLAPLPAAPANPPGNAQ
ncbi:hypothetical protein HMF7854_06270 [Sphingomonas ginkgonis]|uniref:Lipoprotein n=1 Tax=Sphingomonas ginkgonis TaxID=2315330 RepID=A0A3R9WS42_9SPHN|nr:hypothetical protein [Sphingomonas ginkgonis]RST30480.1 hypothetical protein HMF7854_06270 [Sphingomonas ginkgonis]